MKKIYSLPFHQELAHGTLPPESFWLYLVQDHLFLADYSRAFAITAEKLPKNEQTQDFLKLIEDALQDENTLQALSLQKHRPERRTADAQPVQVQVEAHPSPLLMDRSGAAVQYAKIPETEAYAQFLLGVAHTKPVTEAFSSLVSCFWTYQEVWQRIASGRVEHNPYQTWIDLYTSPQYRKATAQATAVLNTLGNEATPKTQRKMGTAFRQATQFEYRFFKATLCHTPKGATQQTSDAKTEAPAPSART